MDDNGLTMEQMQQMLSDSQKAGEDLTAERDSLKEELQKTQEDLAKLKDELQETKKLNYTLGRRLNVADKKESAEDILAALYKEGNTR